MAKAGSRAAFDRLRADEAACRRCDLYERATRTVFGEGPLSASLLFLGESPGDHEDKEGHPFVGPAGHLLDRAFADAGIDRAAAYLTNAVKHFKWRPAGKVRLHQKPSAAETAACTVWWEAELALVQPRIVCCLGATAAQALLGKDFRVTRRRGEFIPLPSGAEATATIHPSAVLRARDRDEVYAGFVHDLQVVAKHLDG